MRLQPKRTGWCLHIGRGDTRECWSGRQREMQRHTWIMQGHTSMVQGHTCRIQGRTWISEEKCRGIQKYRRHKYRRQAGFWSFYISLSPSIFLSRAYALSHTHPLSLSGKRDLALVDTLILGLLIGVKSGRGSDSMLCTHTLSLSPTGETWLLSTHWFRGYS